MEALSLVQSLVNGATVWPKVGPARTSAASNTIRHPQCSYNNIIFIQYSQVTARKDQSVNVTGA